MWAHRIALAVILAAGACTKTPEKSPTRPANEAPPAQAPAENVSDATSTTVAESVDGPMVERAITLKLPDGVSAALYARVRADATLGPALDQKMIPALEAKGTPGERIAAFRAARDKALSVYRPNPTPEEAASPATGPMEDPCRVAFDKVSTDVLRAWFIQSAEAVAAAAGGDAAEVIRALEAAAKTAFPWEPQIGQSVAVRLLLVGRQLEQKSAP
jgi:hypothetical protein